MRKFLIIALILIMIPAAIFAKGAASFGVGATASTGATINGVIENKIDDLKFEDFCYGGYVNVKVFLFSVNGTLFPKFEKDITYFAGDLSANFAIDIIALRLQAGISVNYYGSTDFQNWEFSFEVEDIKDAPLSLRAEVDLMLGQLNVGIWGILPTTATLNTIKDILKVEDRWKDATLGISLGVCF